MDNVVVDLFMHCFLCKAWLLVIVVVVLFVSVYVPLHIEHLPSFRFDCQLCEHNYCCLQGSGDQNALLSLH